MHKSKLAGFIIDCQTDDLAVAADNDIEAEVRRLEGQQLCGVAGPAPV